MASPPLPASASLGQLAVVLEVISREEHREISRLLQLSMRQRQPMSYARLLVRRGVSSQTVEELLRRGASLRAVRCDACGASIPQDSLIRRREYPCLRCGALLLGFRAYAQTGASPAAAPAPSPAARKSFDRAPGQKPPPATGLDLELPTITHGQVLPLPGQGDRRRDLDLPTPSARLARGSEDTTVPAAEAETQATASFHDVLPQPAAELMPDALSTMHFGDVFKLPGLAKAELSDEDMATAYGALTSDQGSVEIHDSAAPEEYAEIGGFKVLAALGEGGMGRVYLARHSKSGRDVALKVLRGTLIGDEEFLQRFQREARSVSGAAHPNVVEMVAQGHDDYYDMHYIAFEYLEGGTLEDKIHDDGAVLEAEALRITLGIARGLEFTASLGIVHRDVKPSNVILTKDGKPKLADLGLARHLDATTRVTQAGVVLGTPAYIAPEQATDVEDLDVRADLYALGICLYEMLTGTLPLEDGVNTTQLLLRHVEEDVPDVRLEAPGVTPATAQLVKGLTARARKRRYRTPTAAIYDIERVIAGKEPVGPKEALQRSKTAGGSTRRPAAPAAPREPSASATPAAPPAPATPPAARPSEGKPSKPAPGSSNFILALVLLGVMLTVAAACLGLAWHMGWLRV
jgi:serine/threonine protein kinase